MPKSRSSRSKSPQKPLTAAEIASQSEREKIFQNVQEMFKDTVDADVIYIVLTECNWRGEEAIDKLLAIGENVEIQRHYKSKSQLQQIAEGVFGSLRCDEHPSYGTPPSGSSSSMQTSPLSQKDKVIQRPPRTRSAEKLADTKTETQGLDLTGKSHLHVPLGGMSSRGPGSTDAQQISPKTIIDDIELDLHFPQLPKRKGTLSRSSASSPISSHRTYSSQVQSGSQPDLMTEAQTAYQQQYDDAAGAQRWEECKNILSDHYVMKSISGPRRGSGELPDRKNEKAPHISKSKSADEPSSGMMSSVFMDDPAIIQSQAERPKLESSRSFPVRLLSRSPDDESVDSAGGTEGQNSTRLDSADLDETVLKCIYEVHDDLLDQNVFERKRSASGKLSDMESDRMSAGTPDGSGHITPTPISQPMTLPVIGLSAHAAEFVPRQPKSNKEEEKTANSKTSKDPPPSKEMPASKEPPPNKAPIKAPVKSVKSKSIEIKTGAKNMRINSPTLQVASASPLSLSPVVSPVVSPPSPHVGSPAVNLAGSPASHLAGSPASNIAGSPVANLAGSPAALNLAGSPATSNLAGSPMFITPKWQPLFPRIPTTPPPPLRPPVSVIAASGTRYITPPPPHHLPPPQYRLQGAPHLPFSSRIVYPVAPPPPVFHMSRISPQQMAPRVQQPMTQHGMPASVEERARIATGQPIMATSEVGRHVTPPTAGLAIQLINQPSIEKNIQRLRELHQVGKKVLVIIRGLPGSGKTTLSRALKQDGVVLSTDDYFMKGDMYDYNPEKLPESHQWNRERAKEAIKMGTSPIIIDNTNTQRWEFKPYVSMALNNNYHVEIMEPDTPWKNNPKELARLTVHGVPKDHIQRMAQRYERNITVDMLTTKKKGIATASQGSTSSQGSFEEDTSQGKPTSSTVKSASVSVVNNGNKRGQGRVGARLGAEGKDNWDMNHEGPVMWSESPKNPSSRSSSIDKELDPTAVNNLGPSTDSITINVNGERFAADKARSGSDPARKPPSLHGLNSRAKSLEKSEVLASQRTMSPKVAEKKAAAPKQEIDLSEETVKVVEDLVSEYVNNKSLSADDLSKVEEELKALLQIYPLDDRERVAAEQLIGQKLHGAPGADEKEEVDYTLAINDAIKESLKGIEKLNNDKNSLQKAILSDIKVLDGAGLEPYRVGAGCAEISNEDIAEPSKKTRRPLNVISNTVDTVNCGVPDRNHVGTVTDIEKKYWGKEQSPEKVGAEVVKPVSTDWGDMLVHHPDWSNEIPADEEGVVRPQRQNKLRHNSSNSKLKTDSDVSQATPINNPNETVSKNEGNVKPEEINETVSKNEGNVKPEEINETVSKNESKEKTEEISEELDTSGSSKHTSEESSSRDYELADLNGSGNSSYLSALDNSQSSGDNKISDVLCDSQDISGLKEVAVDEENNNSEPSESRDEAAVTEVEDKPAQAGDNVSTESNSVESNVNTSISTESTNLDAESINPEKLKPSNNKDENFNTSKSVEEEASSNVIENHSLSLLKESYSESGLEDEKPSDRSQEKLIDDALTEIKTDSQGLAENAQDLTSEDSIINEEQDLVPDENQNVIAVAAEEECNAEKVNTDTVNVEELNTSADKSEDSLADKSEESMPEKGNTEKRKKPSRRKLAANFHGPFFKDTDKENFKTGDWTKYPITSEHLNVSQDNPEAQQPVKNKFDGRDEETMTTDEDFTNLNILCQGGFVPSDVYYISSSGRKIVNLGTDSVEVTSDERSIRDKYTINQSTSTHDLQSENSDSVAFLKTCFPNTKEEELVCVLATCDDNVEWAIDLLLEWNYDSELSTEEKKDFVERLESVTKSASESPIHTQSKVSSALKQPCFLRDICFNFIEEKLTLSKEELEKQLIQTGKERLERIEGENLTKIRLRRTSSMSDASPRGHKRRSKSESELGFSRSLSSPGTGLNKDIDPDSIEKLDPAIVLSKESEVNGRKEVNQMNVTTDLVENADVFSPHPVKIKESVMLENGAIDEQIKQADGLVNDLDDLSSTEAEVIYERIESKRDERKDKIEEVAQNEARFNSVEKRSDAQLDYEAEAEGLKAHSARAVTMKMDGGFVEQLEEMFGPVRGHNRAGSEVKVEIDHGTAWKLYQCLKHSLVDRRQKIRRQMAEDEELARRLQQQEEVRSLKAENQPSTNAKTGPPPLVGVSGYQHGGSPPRQKPVARSQPVRNQPVKPLVEIMEEEAKIQSREQKFEKLVKYEGGHTQLATRMKRNKLYDRFPDLDRTMLDEVFQNHCFNLTETIQHIDTHLGEGIIIPDVQIDGGMSEEKLLAAAKLQSVQDRLNSFLYTPHVSKDYQDGAEPEYEDYRGEAHLHHRLRHECFQKAQEAYRRGLQQVASFYSQQGHLHTQKIKEANRRASELILEDRNEDLERNMTLDLHGLHVEEAVEALETILPQKQREQRRGHLTVITGRGSHSRGGVARLRPSVLAFLRKQQYNFAETQKGIIKVSLKYK